MAQAVFLIPNTLTRDNSYISPFADPEYPADDYYYTDAISDHASRFIREHDKAKPFFLYVAYTAAHWPMHAKEKDIAKYKGRYAAGYETIGKHATKRCSKKASSPLVARRTGRCHRTWAKKRSASGSRGGWRSSPPWWTAWIRALAAS